MLWAGKALKAVGTTSKHFRCSGLRSVAAVMGEGCCGPTTAPSPTEQTNGVHQNGNANTAPKGPQKPHKEAADELQGWIAQRLQLFDTFAERQKQQVGDQRSSGLAALRPEVMQQKCLAAALLEHHTFQPPAA